MRFALKCFFSTIRAYWVKILRNGGTLEFDKPKNLLLLTVILVSDNFGTLKQNNSVAAL
jgi:hypothetical protein